MRTAARTSATTGLQDVFVGVAGTSPQPGGGARNGEPPGTNGGAPWSVLGVVTTGWLGAVIGDGAALHRLLG